jgi:hypothetical protein
MHCTKGAGAAACSPVTPFQGCGLIDKAIAGLTAACWYVHSVPADLGVRSILARPLDLQYQVEMLT